MEYNECGICGLPHVTPRGTVACTAHKSHTNREEPCRQSPIRGSNVCYYHGGRSGPVRRAAAERLELEKVEREIAKLGVKVHVNPGEELLDVIAHTAGVVRFLRRKVEELQEKDMGWGLARVKEGGEDFGETYEAKPNVWIQMLESWTDRHSRLLVEALKLNLDDRRVRLAEAQGIMMMKALDKILTKLGHDPEDFKVATIVAKELAGLALPQEPIPPPAPTGNIAVYNLL